MCAHALVSAQLNIQWALCRTSRFSLCAVLCSPVLCAANAIHLWPSRALDAEATGLPFPALPNSRQLAGHPQSSPCLCPISTVISFVVRIHCVENSCFIYFVFFSPGSRVNRVLFCSILAGSRRLPDGIFMYPLKVMFPGNNSWS